MLLKKCIYFTFVLLIIQSHISYAVNVVFRTSFSLQKDKPVCEIDLLIGRKLKVLDPVLDKIPLKYKVQALLKKNDTIVGFNQFFLEPPKNDWYTDIIHKFSLQGDFGLMQMELLITEYSDQVTTDTIKRSLFYRQVKGPQLSDIQLTGVLIEDAKKQVKLAPNPLLLMTTKVQDLYVYIESYHTDELQDDFYFLKYNLELANTGERKLVQWVRKTKENEDAILQKFSIAGLDQGAYKMTIQLLNSSKELIQEKSILFQRESNMTKQNKIKKFREYVELNGDIDPLWEQKLDSVHCREVLKAIAVVSAQEHNQQINQLLQRKKVKDQKQFVIAYFTKINKEKPAIPYQQLMQKAHWADSVFKGGFGHGFESDRGRIFMKYGIPNDLISVDDDPSAPPYEIWKFEQLHTGENNAKFLFYSPNLTSSDFVLLHSNVRYELQNPRWERELYKNAPDEYEGDNYIDATRMKRNWNRQARALFEQ